MGMASEKEGGLVNDDYLERCMACVETTHVIASSLTT